MKSITVINNISIALLGIFNVGMIFRMASFFLQAMGDEEVNPWKKVKNYIKAMIIIDGVSTLVIIIKNYF